MKSLTLEQVKQVGRFAWQVVDSFAWDRSLGRDFFGDGKERYGPRGFLGVWTFDTPHLHVCRASDGGRPSWAMERYIPPSDGPAFGWHHLPGCDCQFCAEAGDD